MKSHVQYPVRFRAHDEFYGVALENPTDEALSIANVLLDRLCQRSARAIPKITRCRLRERLVGAYREPLTKKGRTLEPLGTGCCSKHVHAQLLEWIISDSIWRSPNIFPPLFRRSPCILNHVNHFHRTCTPIFCSSYITLLVPHLWHVSRRCCLGLLVGCGALESLPFSAVGAFFGCGCCPLEPEACQCNNSVRDIPHTCT